MKKALIFWGGWDGHEPDKVAFRFARYLEQSGIKAEVFEGLDCLADRDKLLEYDLIVPCFTMGEINAEYRDNVCNAVAHGTGLAGCHGGMCDSFRNDTEWQFMTGSQWVSHPGCDGIDYIVNVINNSSPITEGLEDFPVCSEQYYLHYDPAVEILATTRFPTIGYFNISNKPVDMPVAYTKYWGLGRVFYCSLGHHDDVFDKFPTAGEIMRRGLLWAADSKEYCEKNSLSPDKYYDSSRL